MQSDQQSRRTVSTVSVASYTAEEVIARFQALYDTYNFKELVGGLELSFFQIGRRRKALRELKVISIALWYTALQRSFPQEADAFLARYRETAPFLQNSSTGPRLQARLDVYLGLLRDKGHMDFSPLAHYFIEVVTLGKNHPRQQLKMSLLFRDLYSLIFANLV